MSLKITDGIVLHCPIAPGPLKRLQDLFFHVFDTAFAHGILFTHSLKCFLESFFKGIQSFRSVDPGPNFVFRRRSGNRTDRRISKTGGDREPVFLDFLKNLFHFRSTFAEHFLIIFVQQLVNIVIQIPGDLGENIEVASYTAEEQEVEEETVVVKEEVVEETISEEGKTIEVQAEMDRPMEAETISTLEGIEDTYTEETTQEISEIIPVEHFETDFEKLAANEGLISNEELSKYIILDTGDVLPEGAEENTTDTKTLPTLYLNQTLRSGQTVNYEGNILIIGDAHPGSEIIADGDITVWGILGGIAHAGSKGNITAKVRALKLNAIQLRIAGLYARRNDTLNVPYVQKTNEFTPEEAQIEEGKIVIYKKLRRD